jgi:outer membrane protein OmpU
MNKLTKIGASALCGSLAAVSAANAGDMTVAGTVDMSWISLPNESVGNPLGIGSNITFSGSGDLDNGWTVAYTVANANANAFSNANVVVTVPGLGDVRIDQGTSATGIDRMDDMTPNVWEEAYGIGLSGTPNTVSGVSGGANIEYTPSFTPDGLTARIAWSKSVSGSNVADKGTSGDNAGILNSGYDISLEASDALTGMEGLTLYGGIAKVDQDQNASSHDGDVEEKNCWC